VKSGKLVRGTSAVLDTREELRDDDEINDQGGRKERVLTDGVHGDGVPSTHHEFRVVLVHGDFGISYCRDVFNNDAVVDFAARLVVKEDLVRGNDVVDNRRFADFFRTELTRCRQIFAVVVT